MSSSLRTQLVTFDGRGTLFKLKNTVGYFYARAARYYGHDIEENQEQLLTKAFKSQWPALSLEHPNYGAVTSLSSQQWWSIMVERVFRGADIREDAIPQKKLQTIAFHLYKEFSTNLCWEVKGDAISSLKTLKTRHPYLKLGVISNTDERLDKILMQLEMRHFFSFAVDSFSAKCEKPDKKIFDRVCEMAKVPPSQSFHVGDNLQLDYLAAKKAGWSALLLSDKNLDCVNEDDRITTLSQVVSKIVYSSDSF